MRQLAETEISAIALVEAKMPDQCGHKFLVAEYIMNAIYDYNKINKNMYKRFLSFVLQQVAIMKT